MRALSFLTILLLVLSPKSHAEIKTSADYVARTSIAGKFTLPSFTAGSVIFSDGTTLVQDNTDLFWDTTNKSMLIGPGPHPATSGTLAITSQPTDTKTTLSVFSTSTNNAVQFENQNAFILSALTASATNSPSINFERARGTLASKAQAQAGDVLGSFIFNGYTGSSDGSFAAGFGAIATENQASGHAGAEMIFETTSNGSTTLIPRLVIDQDGTVEPYASATTPLGKNTLKFKDGHFSDLLQIGVRSAGSTPTCAAADDGSLALTNGHVLCVCNGSSWVQPIVGLAACTF